MRQRELCFGIRRLRRLEAFLGNADRAFGHLGIGGLARDFLARARVFLRARGRRREERADQCRKAGPNEKAAPGERLTVGHVVTIYSRRIVAPLGRLRHSGQFKHK